MSTKEHPSVTTSTNSQHKTSSQPIQGAHSLAAKIQKGPKTRITVQYDVGFPNSLYIRGEGANLSWDKGLLLKNVKSDEWVWETAEPFTSCRFKILINDSDFELGENHLITCGASLCYTPRFH